MERLYAMDILWIWICWPSAIGSDCSGTPTDRSIITWMATIKESLAAASPQMFTPSLICTDSVLK